MSPPGLELWDTLGAGGRNGAGGFSHLCNGVMKRSQAGLGGVWSSLGYSRCPFQAQPVPDSMTEMIYSLPRPHRAGTLLLPSLHHSSTGGAGRMRICVRKGQPRGLKSCPFPEIPSGHPCVPRASFPCPWASSQRQRGNDIIPSGWHHRPGASPPQGNSGCWAAPGLSLGCSAPARPLPPAPESWGVLQAQPQSLWGRARTPCRICPGLVWAQGSGLIRAQLQPEHSQPAPGEPLELLQQLHCAHCSCC